jgi:hypothetical protein
MWHRPLSEMLVDVFASIETLATADFHVRARQVDLDLPIETQLIDEKGELTFIADLPLWRWRTDFDQPTSRLRISYEERQT